MPVISTGDLTIDYAEYGQGTTVILVHSSVSGNRQWRALAEALQDRFHVLAVNLYGYGSTTAWRGPRPQTLADQARLVAAVCGENQETVHIVGHSFGASVALKAAALLDGRVGKLVLLEPNPTYLLKRHGREEAYEESRALRDHVKKLGGAGDWAGVASRFADYFNGEGTWASMPEKRRQAFAALMPPNFHEWDAVMDEGTTLAEWGRLRAATLLVHAADTRRPIAEIAALFSEACPHWKFARIPEGGHMAPLTRPDLVNPLVAEFLA
jgi:pimeloyl-ACP methyl ester carboxylesterase